MNIAPITQNFTQTNLNSKTKKSTPITKPNLNFQADIINFKRKKPKKSLLDRFLSKLGINGDDYEYTTKDILEDIEEDIGNITIFAADEYKDAKKEVKIFKSYFKLGQRANWHNIKTGMFSKQIIEFSRVDEKNNIPKEIIVSNEKDGLIVQYNIEDKDNFSIMDYTQYPRLIETEIQDGQPIKRTYWSDESPEETTFEFDKYFDFNDNFVYKKTHRDNSEIIYDKVFYANPSDNSDLEYIQLDEETGLYDFYVLNKDTNELSFNRTTDYYPYN